MKIFAAFILLIILSSSLHASCVNWSEVYRCGNGDASLHLGQSWCAGNNKEAYHLTINSTHAQEHLSTLARTQLSFLSLLPTENYGVFTSNINQYVTAVVSENHQDASLNVELFMDNKKLGEYIFRNCSF